MDLTTRGAAHSYLEGVEDLEGHAAVLEIGTVYNLPLLPLENTVVSPGDVVPLRLLAPFDRLAVRLALTASPPTARLIALVCSSSSGGLRLEDIGVVAEIVKKSQDGTNAVAIARQRIQLQHSISLQSVPLSVLPDVIFSPHPPGIESSWPSFVYKQFSATELATRALKLYREKFPRAVLFSGDPLALSFWLISALPLDIPHRQLLLEMPDGCSRLSKELHWLQHLSSFVVCDCCDSQLAKVEDLIQTNGTGHVVNSYGVIHEVATVSSVAANSLVIEGEPTSENSWFEGYLWQIIYCSQCESHLGWRFVAKEGEDARPLASFFGFRRTGISVELSLPHDVSDHDDG